MKLCVRFLVVFLVSGGILSAAGHAVVRQADAGGEARATFPGRRIGSRPRPHGEAPGDAIGPCPRQVGHRQGADAGAARRDRPSAPAGIARSRRPRPRRGASGRAARRDAREPPGRGPPLRRGHRRRGGRDRGAPRRPRRCRRRSLPALPEHAQGPLFAALRRRGAGHRDRGGRERPRRAPRRGHRRRRPGRGHGREGARGRPEHQGPAVDAGDPRQLQQRAFAAVQRRLRAERAVRHDERVRPRGVVPADDAHRRGRRVVHDRGDLDELRLRRDRDAGEGRGLGRGLRAVELRAARLRVPVERLRLVGPGHGRRQSVAGVDPHQVRILGQGRRPRAGPQPRALPLALARLRIGLGRRLRLLHVRIRRRVRPDGKQFGRPLQRVPEGTPGLARRRLLAAAHDGPGGRRDRHVRHRADRGRAQHPAPRAQDPARVRLRGGQRMVLRRGPPGEGLRRVPRRATPTSCPASSSTR